MDEKGRHHSPLLKFKLHIMKSLKIGTGPHMEKFLDQIKQLLHYFLPTAFIDFLFNAFP